MVACWSFVRHTAEHYKISVSFPMYSETQSEEIQSVRPSWPVTHFAYLQDVSLHISLRLGLIYFHTSSFQHLDAIVRAIHNFEKMMPFLSLCLHYSLIVLQQTEHDRCDPTSCRVKEDSLHWPNLLYNIYLFNLYAIKLFLCSSYNSRNCYLN